VVKECESNIWCRAVPDVKSYTYLFCHKHKTIMWDFRFSRQMVWSLESSEMLRRVITLKLTDDHRPDDGGSTHLWNVNFNVTTRRYIPEDCKLQDHHFTPVRTLIFLPVYSFPQKTYVRLQWQSTSIRLWIMLRVRAETQHLWCWCWCWCFVLEHFVDLKVDIIMRIVHIVSLNT
jgi:hypothetical protein